MKLKEIDDPASSIEWGKLWSRDTFQHPCYLPSELRVAATHYQPLYYLPSETRSAGTTAPDRCFVAAHLLAYDDDGPVMGLALTIEQASDGTRLSAYGRPLYVVEDRAAGGVRLKAAAKLIHHRLLDLAAQHATAGFHLRDFLVDGQLSWLSELILRDGGTTQPFFTQLIDLAAPADELHADLRRNVRRILRKDRPGYSTVLIGPEEVTEQHVDTLRTLHRALRGRDLRASASWAAVLDCVSSGDAFLAFGVEDDRTIAGAYFPVSDRYCYYGIAAHDPARYGAGLSHHLLWTAILRAKALGCRYFEVGDRLYPRQHRWLADKYHSISDFKAGFSGLVATRLDVFAAGPLELPAPTSQLAAGGRTP